MLCPCPTACEYDAFRRTGEHTCGRVKCPYRIHTRRILAGQIKQLAALESRTERQEAYLDRLKAQYAELLESG